MKAFQTSKHNTQAKSARSLNISKLYNNTNLARLHKTVSYQTMEQIYKFHRTMLNRDISPNCIELISRIKLGLKILRVVMLFDETIKCAMV